MKYILLVILLVIALCVFLSIKYSNPYKLLFIFGKKGAGKSTLMVKHMIKDQKRGWTIYTDMESIRLEGARVIKVADLKDHIPPPHSAVYLEEVGLTFDNRKFKDFDDGYNRLMKFLRKHKLKMYMNSQAFDVDVKIRNLTDGMVLCTAFLNCISVVRPIRRSVTLTAPTGDSESRIADKLQFDRIWNWQLVWMPRYFKYFDSFDVDPLPLIDYREVFPLGYSGDSTGSPALDEFFAKYSAFEEFETAVADEFPEIDYTHSNANELPDDVSQQDEE